MIPVSDKVRERLLQAIESELEQLRIEETIPAADKGLMTDDEYAAAIVEFEVIQQDLLDNRLVVFDLRPQCVKMDGEKRCEGKGRYTPIILVFLPNQDQPLAQLDVQPVIHVCENHARGRINDYLNKAQWREIQAQVMQQAKQMVHFGDAKIMFMDHDLQTIVPPPLPDIQIVGAEN